MAVLDVCRMPVFSIFKPFTNVISAITNSFPAEVTTVNPHQYESGLIVRIDVPPADGMEQINQQTATITVNSPTTFLIDIDTTFYFPFIIPEDPDFPGLPPQGVQVCALVVPFGEINSQLTQATRNILPRKE